MPSRLPAWILALLTLVGATPAAVAAAVQEEHYILLRGGHPYGAERFSVETRGDTLELRGDLRYGDPPTREYRTRTRLVGADEDLLDYLLTSPKGDSLGLRVEGDSLRFFSYTANSRRERVIAAAGRRPQLLDNTLASHLWLLARQLVRDSEAATPLLGLVPQRLWAGPIDREPAQPVTGEAAGAPIELLRHRLSIAGQFTLVDTDASGLLYGMSVPLQQSEIRRPDFSPAPGPPLTAPTAEAPRVPSVPMTVEGGGPPLSGLLTLPDSTGGPWPTCLFLHGSGPIDKDMTIGPNRIFAQLAAGLAARGIASLRYDKRTFAISRSRDLQERFGAAVNTLQEEVLDDALAAWRLLAEDPRLDRERLFVLGHSLGAGAAPMLAEQIAAEALPRPAGLLLLAPPGRDLLEIMLDQYRYLNSIGVVPGDDLARAERDAERLRLGGVGDDELVLFAKPRYWHSVRSWQPWQDYLEQAAPALVLFGERDYQITAPDRETWQRALAAGQRPGAELVLLPGLNHLFLRGEGKPGPAELSFPGELEADLLDRLAAWIAAAAPAGP